MSKKNRPMRQDVPAAPVQREAAAPRKGLLKEPLARCFFYLFPILLFLSITVLTRKGSVCVAAGSRCVGCGTALPRWQPP